MRPWLIIYPIVWFIAIVLAALGASAEAWNVVVFAVLLGVISGAGMIYEFSRITNQRK